jgi:hypothetical protein
MVVTGTDHNYVTACVMRAILREDHELHKDPEGVPATAAVAAFTQCSDPTQVSFRARSRTCRISSTAQERGLRPRCCKSTFVPQHDTCTRS